MASSAGPSRLAAGPVVVGHCWDRQHRAPARRRLSDPVAGLALVDRAPTGGGLPHNSDGGVRTFPNRPSVRVERAARPALPEGLWG
jgi:hypothetical protein